MTKECDHNLGYEVEAHEPYSYVVIACLECGAVITYWYRRKEQ